MIYCYDNAIADDLARSFNTSSGVNPTVKVISPDNAVDILAQIQNDEITFPLVVLSRDPETPIDTDRMNFTYAHRGVVSVLDPKTNKLYYERVLPIKLSYTLTILTTNTYDMDELVRELLFKYISMYFITVDLPYECDRQIRFGISPLVNTDIERSSGSFEYISGGSLYQSIMHLTCEGCVLVHYTPAHLRRLDIDVEYT